MNEWDDFKIFLHTILLTLPKSLSGVLASTIHYSRKLFQLRKLLTAEFTAPVSQPPDTILAALLPEVQSVIILLMFCL